MQDTRRGMTFSADVGQDLCGVNSLHVLATEQGIRGIGFAGENWGAVDELAEDVASRHVAGRHVAGRHAAEEHIEEAARQLEEYLAGERREFTVPVDFSGVATPFRRRATEALAQIPYGETITYAQLAALAGNPRAVRAAASACARNPLPILYPCHRVIRSDGSLGEYRGGAETKRALLEMERALISRI